MKKIEEQFKELDEISHVLLRSETYVGSKVSKETIISVIDDSTHLFEEKNIEYSPALLKLIDEIITNSVDEHQRCKESGEHLLDTIKVNVTENGEVTVWDNGGIPVVEHKLAKMYIPDFIFSKLRAGSNFNDGEGRVVTGKNGLGSVLTNIFSKTFRVTTADGKKQFQKTWSENKRKWSDVTISKSKEHFTEIKFQIDMSQFEENTLSYGVIKMIERRCILAAASKPKLKVIFNDNEYLFNTFEEYVKLYGYKNLIHEHSKYWDLFIAPCEENGGKSYSIVNGGECNKGTHVTLIRELVRDSIKKECNKLKHIPTPQEINKQYISFINMNVVDPVYDAQTKEILETKPNLFSLEDEKPCFCNKFIKKLQNSNIVKQLQNISNDKENLANNKDIKNANSKIKKVNTKLIEKFIDVSNVKKKERKECSLFIVEGDSAGKHFRSARNPKRHAAYLLKGKVTNTIDMKAYDLIKHKEINDIITILGLGYNEEIDINNLKFGKIIIASDADIDGACIAGQVLSFFAIHYPQLFEHGCVYRVKPPIVKAEKFKDKKVDDIKYFYDLKEFNKAKNLKKYDISYLKGLGSMTKNDYKDMLYNPILERFTITEDSTKSVNGWMCKDSKYRKMKLEDSI